MVISLMLPLARDCALTFEVANYLLLLCVNTEYWDAISFTLRTNFLDFLTRSKLDFD